MNERIKLFIPGPIEVMDDALMAQTKPMIGHRSKEFEALYADIQPKLRQLLYTKNRIYVAPCTGSGWWEGVARNCCEKKALACVLGAFSDKWSKVIKSNGKEMDKYEVPMGKHNLPEEIRKRLSTREYDLLALVHNETSTGVMNPINEISEVMKDFPEVIFAVDAVSSMSGVKIEADKLGIDILLASSQKAFGLPPGLSVCMASDKALEKSKKMKAKGYYFDFEEWEKSHLKNQTPMTSGISLMHGLQHQLNKFFKEGLEKRFRRHIEMAEFTQTWGKKNFDLFAEPGFESITLTTITNTKGINVAGLNKELEEKYKMTLSNGYGDLKEKTFRIAHMGDYTVKDIKELTDAIEEILKL
ncbi:MAG: alanine--glyoxylate aminotransferase family protein [Candidatus Diapherotrites archaeon]